MSNIPGNDGQSPLKCSGGDKQVGAAISDHRRELAPPARRGDININDPIAVPLKDLVKPRGQGTCGFRIALSLKRDPSLDFANRNNAEVKVDGSLGRYPF